MPCTVVLIVSPASVLDMPYASLTQLLEIRRLYQMQRGNCAFHFRPAHGHPRCKCIPGFKVRKDPVRYAAFQLEKSVGYIDDLIGICPVQGKYRPFLIKQFAAARYEPSDVHHQRGDTQCVPGHNNTIITLFHDTGTTKCFNHSYC